MFGNDDNERRGGDGDDYNNGGRGQEGGRDQYGGGPAGKGFRHDGDDDLSGAAHIAAQRNGDGESQSFFGDILDKISGNKSKLADEDIDEDEAVRQHKNFFSDEGDSSEATGHGMGSAAAMQALKMFTSGTSSSSSNMNQSEFVGLAMSEASKLFDSQSALGKVAEGSSKDSAVQKAGEMAMKMYLKYKFGV